MATDELDKLLMDRFNLGRADVIAALKALPAQRPWAAALTEADARLLDSVGFTADPDASAEIAANAIAQMGRLYNTAYSAAEVAKGLGVNDSRVRQRRLAHTLWAIDDAGTWVYPSLQFEVVDNGRTQAKLKQIRGLEQVLPRLLTLGRHPAAVAGFVTTPQPVLSINGQPRSVKDWLLHGESVQPVLQLIDISQWAVT